MNLHHWACRRVKKFSFTTEQKNKLCQFCCFPNDNFLSHYEALVNKRTIKDEICGNGSFKLLQVIASDKFICNFRFLDYKIQKINFLCYLKKLLTLNVISES